MKRIANAVENCQRRVFPRHARNNGEASGNAGLFPFRGVIVGACLPVEPTASDEKPDPARPEMFYPR